MAGKVFRLASEGAEHVARDFAKVGGAGEEMAKKVTQGAKSMTPALRAADTAAAELKKSVDDAANKGGALGKVLASMGPVGIAAAAALTAATAGAAGLANAAKQASDECLALEGAARKAGVGVEFLQELRAAAGQVGQELTAIEPALSNFNVRLGEIRAGIASGSTGDPLWAVRQLGIGPEAQDSTRTAEELFAKVAKGLEGVTDAASRQKLADALGLKDLLPLLEQGEQGLTRLRTAAQESGLVLDEQVVKRGAETARQWEAASSVIGVQLREAALNVAPVFLDLLKILAQGARELSAWLDNFKELEQRADASLVTRRRQLDEERRRRVEAGAPTFASRAGEVALGVLQGPGALMRRNITQDAPARDLAEIDSELADIEIELNRRRRDRNQVLLPGASGGGRPRTGGAGSTVRDPAEDSQKAEIARLDGLLAQLDATRLARERFARVQAENVGLTREEVDAQIQLEDTLAALDRAQALGLGRDQQRLQAIRESVLAADADSKAQRRRAADTETIARLVAVQEQPLDLYRRQINALERAHADGAISAEQYALGISRADEELRRATGLIGVELSNAREAFRDGAGSLAAIGRQAIERSFRTGEPLDGDGVRLAVADWWRNVLFDAFLKQPFDELEKLTVESLQGLVDSVFGQLEGRKGVAGSIFDFGSSLFGRGAGKADSEGVKSLNNESKAAAVALKTQLSQQAVASGVEFAVQAATVKGSTLLQSNAGTTLATAFLSTAKAAQAAASALSKVAATEPAGKGGNPILSLVSSFLGAGGSPLPRFAAGGFASGLALVGEDGPELAYFREPARVVSASRTRQLLQSSSAAAPSFTFAPVLNVAGGSAAEVAALRAELDRQRAAFEGFVDTFNPRVWGAVNDGDRRRYTGQG